MCSASRDGLVAIWDLTKQRQVVQLETDPANPVHCVNIVWNSTYRPLQRDPRRENLLLCFDDGSVRLWDVDLEEAAASHDEGGGVLGADRPGCSVCAQLVPEKSPSAPPVPCNDVIFASADCAMRVGGDIEVGVDVQLVRKWLQHLG
jgi:WD40 repeat protein